MSHCLLISILKFNRDIMPPKKKANKVVEKVEEQPPA